MSEDFFKDVQSVIDNQNQSHPRISTKPQPSFRFTCGGATIPIATWTGFPWTIIYDTDNMWVSNDHVVIRTAGLWSMRATIQYAGSGGGSRLLALWNGQGSVGTVGTNYVDMRTQWPTATGYSQYVTVPLVTNLSVGSLVYPIAYQDSTASMTTTTGDALWKGQAGGEFTSGTSNSSVGIFEGVWLGPPTY